MTYGYEPSYKQASHHAGKVIDQRSNPNRQLTLWKKIYQIYPRRPLDGVGEFYAQWLASLSEILGE